MKVPMNERNINLETPQIQAPSMPRISMPNVIPEAFGKSIAEATENLGKVGEKIASHLQRLAIDEQDKEVLKRETSYRQDLQNRLLNQEDETVQIGGQDVTRKKGLMLRQLGQAKGATEELDQVYQKELLPKYLKGLSRYQLEKLGPALNNYYLSSRDNLITHEANSLSEDLKNTTEANIAQKINDYSPLVKTEDNMQKAIQDIVGSSEVWNRQFDPVTQEVNKRKTIDKFVSEVARWNIYNDQSRQENQSMVLTELKDNKGMYRDLTQDARIKLVEESQRRIFQNNQTFKRQVEDSQGERNDTFIDKLASGTATLNDVDSEMAIPEEAGGMKRQTLFTYQKALQSGITKDLNRMLTEKTADKDPTTRAKKVSDYLELIDSFIDNKADMWAARDQLARAYSDGIINPKEQLFLNNLKKNLKNIEANRSSWPIANNIRTFINKMKGYNATDEEITLNLKSLLGTGNITEESTLQALGNHVKSKIPGVSALPKEGQIFFDKDGNEFTIYPDGSIK